MYRYLPARLLSVFCFLFIGLQAMAQLPTCDYIYIMKSTSIDNYNPLLPISATNPKPNTIVLPTPYSGLTVSPVLRSGSSTLTFYTVAYSATGATYVYYDPTTSAWVNTGHSTGSAAAVNIAAGGDYIYNLVGGTGEVFRYDGTGTGVLIATVPGFAGVGPYDLVADCEGNWYIFNQSGTTPFLRKYNSSGTLLHSWVIHNPLGLSISASGGFAIIGTTLYTDNASGGIASYTLGKDTLTVTGVAAGPSVGADDLGCCAGNVPTRPEVKISATETDLCGAAHPVTYTATPLAGGPGPKYQWYVNGIPVGPDAPTYTYTPAHGDKVTCTMTSNSPCASPPVVNSDTIKMVITGSPLSPPTVISPVHYCRWASGPALTATKANPADTLVWYTSVTGPGTTTAILPATGGTAPLVYYVSERNGRCESDKVAIEVIIDQANIADFTFQHPTTCGGKDGWIKFRTNRNNKVHQVFYDKDGMPEPVLSLMSDVSGYITLSGLGKGSYTAFYVISDQGCKSSTEYGPIVLKGPSAIPPVATNNGPVCEGAMAELSTRAEAGTTYLWKGPGGFSSTDTDPGFVAGMDAAGVYTLVSAKGDCISDPVPTTLVVNPLPRKYQLPDQSVCEGSDLLVEQPQESTTTYEWTDESGAFILRTAVLSRKGLSLTQGGLYILHAETEHGCIMRDTISVSVHPQTTLSLSADTAICSKDSITLFAQTNTEQVQWSPAAAAVANAKELGVRPDKTTTYTATAKSDQSACPDVSAKVTVTVLPLPEIRGFDTTVRMNIPYQLLPVYSTGLVTWKWVPADSLSCSDCPAPVFNSSSNMTYTVYGTDSHGCMGSAEVNVQVFCDGANVTMPNAFTPNQDGKNDVFYVRGKGFTVKSFRIYNRFGQEVFAKENFGPNDPQYGWNGAFNGAAVTESTGFVYMIEAVCHYSTTPFVIKGTVLLVR